MADGKRFEGSESYVATGDLQVAVNAAIALERPLLVKGEPGTGKTQLALEVADGRRVHRAAAGRGAVTATVQLSGCSRMP